MLQCVYSTEKNAKVRDTVIRKKPKLKKIMIRVGENKEAGIKTNSCFFEE